MVTQIVGMQQILITVIFLACLIGLLVFLRMKGGSIKANLQKGQRIKVVEETAVSPAERLRLINIDGREFVMLSGKGIQPSLVPLPLTAQKMGQLSVESDFVADDRLSNQFANANTTPDKAPLELTNPAYPNSLQPTDTLHTQEMESPKMDPLEVAEFAAKFKGWRKKI